MRSRFIIGVIAAFGSFTLAFEAIGAESRGPDFQLYRVVPEPVLPLVK
jgi:hypothetical protein